VHNLGAIERLTRPTALEDEDWCTLESLIGGEAVGAFRARTTTADCGAIIGGTRIDHLGVVVLTNWTMHEYEL